MNTLRDFFLSHSNPVLQRELRVTLRNVRTFMLLAIYVAVLGAIVLVQFPADTALQAPGNSVSENGVQSTATLGRSLFWTFMGAQALLICALIPLLATGALAQERERRTLEPLLLSSLTPLQIVWGKATGVLAVTLMLLCATLPLTALSFLLGGVSPGELVGGYSVLLALSLYFTGIGLYAAAKYQNTTRATIWCYVVIAMSIPLLTLAVTFGAMSSGLLIAGLGISAFWRRWQKWAPGTLSHLQPSRRTACGVLVVVGLGAVILGLARQPDVGQFVIYGLFVTPSLVFLSLFPMQRAALALEKASRQELPLPTREWAQNVQDEWQRVLTPSSTGYLPSPTGKYTYTPQMQPSPSYATASAAASAITEERQAHHAGGAGGAASRTSVPTYGIKAFLPDRLNPVFAREMRSGLGGKGDCIFRYSYIVTIATQLLLILYLTPQAAYLREVTWFLGAGKLHLFVLMIAGAWLGARAIAPEREKQVLPQLLSTPLPASAIIKGKVMTIAVYTFYIFMLFLPLALILPWLGLVAWQTILYFLSVELVCGFLAASWGLFCSLQGVTARRALGLSLGGILLLTIGGSLVSTTLGGWLQFNAFPSTFWSGYIEVFRHLISPLGLLNSGRPSSYAAYGFRYAPAMGNTQMIVVAIYLLLAGLLLVITANSFRRYSRSL